MLSNGIEMQKHGAYIECLENPPDIPYCFFDVWQWFLDLNLSRKDSETGLSLSDIKAFFDLLDTKPSQWELEILQNLDNEFLRAFREKDVEIMNTAT